MLSLLPLTLFTAAGVLAIWSIAASFFTIPTNRRARMSAHRYRLSMVHQRLKAEINREESARRPDEWRLLRLKKLKLAIKDMLQQRHPAAERLPITRHAS